MSDSGSNGMDEWESDMDNEEDEYFDDGEESRRVVMEREERLREGEGGWLGEGLRWMTGSLSLLRWKRSWRRWRKKNRITSDDQVSLDSGCLMSVLA